MNTLMTTTEVANRLIELCRKGEWETAQKELYDTDIVSHEPQETGGDVSRGIDGILEKNKKWADMTEEVHDFAISDPLIGDDYFSCSMMNDVTMKGMGRVKATEICVYQVKDGKIVSEWFYHS